MIKAQIDRDTLTVIVDDLVAAVDNDIWRQRDYRRGLSQRALARLAKAVRQAIREALTISTASREKTAQ